MKVLKLFLFVLFIYPKSSTERTIVWALFSENWKTYPRNRFEKQFHIQSKQKENSFENTKKFPLVSFMVSSRMFDSEKTFLFKKEI